MSFDKPIFHGLLHTNKPDLEALYRVGYIPMVTRAAIANYATTWPDPLGLPTAEWCDAMVSATAAPRGMILMDHEAWPYGTQAERQATAAKYVTLYQDIKARKPGWRSGWKARSIPISGGVGPTMRRTWMPMCGKPSCARCWRRRTASCCGADSKLLRLPVPCPGMKTPLGG